MRSLFCLALIACVATPAAAQNMRQRGRTAPTYSYAQPQGTVITNAPRVSYSYVPPTTYAQPTYTYSQPTYATTPSYSYVTPQPQVIYSTPTYATTPTVVYSTPTTYSTPTYLAPVTYSTPLTYNQPMSYSSGTTMAYSQPRFDNVVWSQPAYNTTPSVVYSQPAQQYGNVIVSNPMPNQPTLNYVPSGNFNQRLMTNPAPSSTRGYAGRVTNGYYR